MDSVDRAPLYRIYDLNGPWDAPAFRTPKWDATADAFRALAKQNNVDALLIVRGRTGGDFIGMSNQSVSGLGLYARGMGNLTTASSAYLLADVWIIDGRTGQPMAGVLLSSGHPSFMGGPLERGVPRAAVGSELTRKPYGQYTDREREQLRSVLVALAAIGVGSDHRQAVC